MTGHNGYCHNRLGGGAYFPGRGVLVYGSDYPVLRARAKEQPTTILVEEPTEYAEVVKDLKSNVFPAGSIAVFDRSAEPDLIMLRLDQKIKKIHLLFNVPRNIQEAQIVHKKTPVGVLSGYQSTFLSVSRDLSVLGGLRIAQAGSVTAKDWVENYISQTDRDDLVIIASHIEKEFNIMRNSSGILVPALDVVLPFVDGSKFYPSTVKGRDRPLIWTVGCNTWDVFSSGQFLADLELSIAGAIDYQEAALIVRRLLSATGAPREAIAAIQRTELPRPRHPADAGRSEKKLRPGGESGGSDHFSKEKPEVRVQVIVENIDGNNILTNDVGVA